MRWEIILSAPFKSLVDAFVSGALEQMTALDHAEVHEEQAGMQLRCIYHHHGKVRAIKTWVGNTSEYPRIVAGQVLKTREHAATVATYNMGRIAGRLPAGDLDVVFDGYPEKRVEAQ